MHVVDHEYPLAPTPLDSPRSYGDRERKIRLVCVVDVCFQGRREPYHFSKGSPPSGGPRTPDPNDPTPSVVSLAMRGASRGEDSPVEAAIFVLFSARKQQRDVMPQGKQRLRLTVDDACVVERVPQGNHTDAERPYRASISVRRAQRDAASSRVSRRRHRP